MSYNTKNYMGNDGKWHIEDVEFAGGVIANQAASTADTVAKLKADFNTLLAALKTCGLMVADD